MSKPSISWMDRPWVAFDTETTGISVESDLIVQAAVADATNRRKPAIWHANWNVDIPEGAARVHGLTRAKLAEIGDPPDRVIGQVVDELARAFQDGVVLGMNLVFDFTMLDRNCRLLGITPLSELVDLAPVADAMVLDKHVDPYRKGRRNLEALAQHYRVPFANAHDAGADALAAARVCYRIGRIFPEVGKLDALVLHDLQVQRKRGQDASFKAYREKNGESSDGLDGAWPLRPLPGPPMPALARADVSQPGGTTPSLFEDVRLQERAFAEEEPW